MTGVEEELLQQMTDMEKQLCRATSALMSIRCIAKASLTYRNVAHEAMDRIDQLAQGGLP